MALPKASTAALIALLLAASALSGYLYMKYASAEQSYEQLSSEHKALENEYSSLYGNYTQLQEHYSELLGNYSSLQAEHESLKKQYEDLSGNYSSLQSQYGALSSQYSALSSSYSALLGNYSSLQSSYNELGREYSSLNASYGALLSNYTNLSAKYDSFIEWYDGLREEVNMRIVPNETEWEEFVTPNDFHVNLEEILITGGWSDPGNWTEYWDDVYSLYDWVNENIYYSYDSPEPLLPSIGGKLEWFSDYWRFPNETLAKRTGDCEDMANLLASMISAYGGGKYYVWVMLVSFDDAAHAAVALPAEGGKLAILDPAGGYYTNLNGELTPKDASVALQEFFDYWRQQGYTNGSVYAIYSDSEYREFTSTQEFISYVESLG